MSRRGGSYVDNAMNRRLGRVGMPYGSCVQSSSRGSSCSSSSSRRDGSYVDNAMNRSLGRVGMPYGSCVQSSSQGSSCSSTSSTRDGSYVDNAMNRSLGRVGMPYGSCVQSSSRGFSYSSLSSSQASSATPQKVYADNPYNRRIGRAGKEFGSHVVSKISTSSASASSTTSSSSSVSQKTYVDNSLNRRLSRVGKPHGSHVQHSDGSVTITPASSSSASASSTTSSSSSVSQKTYVDNSLNRRLGRVGKPHRSHVQHSDGSVTITPASSSSASASSTTSSSSSVSQKTYVDNSLNRRLGCVGKPHGSHVQHSDGSVTIAKTPSPKLYADNAMNRKLGRALQPKGSKPQHAKKKPHDKVRHFVEDNSSEDLMHLPELWDVAKRIAYAYLRRREVEEVWEKEGFELATDFSKVPAFTEKSIPLVEIEMKEKIGEGGFGIVYAGKWKGTLIAFKKLLYQEMTNRKKKEFVNEIEVFSKLNHKNIVKMLGVVTEKDSIGIVMEYLPTTLFQALFIDEVEFSSYKKKKLVSEVILALEYLHDAGITHCDIKCQNVLLDASNVAKICDFGLSMVKNSSASTSCRVSRGTPRYSAPEVLRGEMLQRSQLMMTDIYSLSLLIYQVLVEEEPYDTLSILQLQENVGRGDLRPSLDETNVREPVKELLAKGWAKEPANRPDIHKFAEEWEKIAVILV